MILPSIILRTLIEYPSKTEVILLKGFPILQSMEDENVKKKIENFNFLSERICSDVKD